MKRLRHAALVALLIFIVIPGNSCSPGDPEAIFVRLNGPDTPYKNYAAGRLGVVLGSYRPRHLAIAFDYLNGRPLTPQEQTQAYDAERNINWQSYQQDTNIEPEKPAPGMAQWKAAHEAAVPGTYKTLATDLNIDQYESVPNCLDDAFANAAKTLTARQQSYGKSSPEVLDWLRAQDAVFSNCNGTGSAPQLAPANSPLWLKQDRAYQIAAAHFYSVQFDEAITGFHAIAADSASPWHTIAPYLAVRALIRKTSLAPQPHYDKPDEVAAAKQRVLEGWAAAVHQLDDILRDPALKPIHPAALDLRDLVAARLDPAAQAQALAQRITAAANPSNNLRHNLTDLTYILNNSTDDSGSPLPSAKQIAAAPDPTGLITFIRTLNTPTAPPPPGRYESRPPETPAQTQARLAAQRTAAQTAYRQWQSTQKSAWLVATLDLAQPTDPFAPQLISAARALPQNSPAYTTATFNRLRLEAASPATRTELVTLLPAIEKAESRSTINLFAGLLTRTSPTLADYLKTAPSIPSGVDFEGAIASPADIPTPALCGVAKPDATKTPLFDADAATILNQRLPLRLLREASTSGLLPPNLRFQVANATLTRAVLLDDPATVAAVSPVLATCQPALKPWLDRYNTAAADPTQRHLQGLFLLMRFPSAEPLVRNGNQRSEGFATYSELRDNWWAGNTHFIEPPNNSPNAYDYESGIHPVFPGSPNYKPALFVEPIVPAAQLPSPPFLTAADAADADRELLALQHIPGAADYFATRALDWVKVHPTDPNNSELLGFAMRVVRNASRTGDTKELNHQLFDTLHRRYPNSDWAKRYKTWE